MKYRWGVLLFLLAIAFRASAQSPDHEFVPGKCFVKIKSDANLEFPQFKVGEPLPEMPGFPKYQEILFAYGVRALFKPFKTQNIHVQHIYELRFDDHSRTEEFLREWEQFEFVEYAERIPVYRSHYNPNDMGFLLWQLPKISATGAWDISRGSRDVVVAIVDDAVKLNHEDLAPQIWTNVGEIPGDSIDNDGNGFIDDVNGFDPADQDNDPNPPGGANDNLFSHGTHVAGIAAAATDNGRGIASIGFNVSIMPVKAKEDSTISDNLLQATYTGVDYAIKNRADVVNMSWGSGNYNFSLAYLIQAGYDAGVTFVASAGNTGNYAVFYPAAYSGVISVGSTDFNDQKSGFSTWHYSIDVMAPGGGIYSSTAGGTSNYGFKSGTSMSAPLVTGLVALMLSADSSLSPDDVLACLQSSADNIDAQNPNYVGDIGAGRINAFKAMMCVVPTAIQPAGTASALQHCEIVPNPVGETAKFVSESANGGRLSIFVSDLQGRLVANIWDGNVNEGTFNTVWQRPQSMANGLYLVTWQLEGERLVRKMTLR